MFPVLRNYSITETRCKVSTFIKKIKLTVRHKGKDGEEVEEPDIGALAIKES